MTKIRHIAIKSPNPARLADFYQNVLGLELLHHSGNSYYLTDGDLTLALLQCRPEEAPPGINHFGIQVENTGAIGEKIVAAGLPAPTVRPAKTPFAEHRGMDPDGNLFDISEHGYREVEYPPERAGRK